MLTPPARSGAVLLLVALLALAGCKTAEEKAADYYRSAQSYLEQGDTEHALVELRNVLKYDPAHLEARQLYAETQLARGEAIEAYRQYLTLAEQHPELASVHLTLAELAIGFGDWDETARHGEAALALAPDDPRAQAIRAALDYHKAVAERNDTARDAAATRATDLLAANPELEVARRVAIDGLLAGADPQSAMPLIDDAIAREPKVIEFHLLRHRLLADAGRRDEAGTELEAAYALAPQDPLLRNMLVSWYYSEGHPDEAERLLRQLAGPDDGPADDHLVLISFLVQARGTAAAKAELDRLIAATAGLPQTDFYRGLKAELLFQDGEQDAAMTEMRAILDGAMASDQTRQLQLGLARMLAVSGNQVGARQLVETVLLGDPRQVDALKMRAAWLIRDDQPDAAIIDLRTALDGAPQDVEILLLMAEAHERAGARDLAGDRLRLALDLSDYAPPVALRYADFLLQSNHARSAETVLLSARDRHPGELSLVKALADLWLQSQNWQQLQDLLAALRGRDDEAARSLYGALQAAVLLGQNRTDEGLKFLEKQFAEVGGDRALTLLVLTRLRNGEAGLARDLLTKAMAERRNDPGLQLLLATVEAVAGNTGEAETLLRALIAGQPEAEAPVRMLVSLLLSAGRRDEAAAVLDAALALQPKSVALRLSRAGLHEAAGEFDAALALYEALYADDSDNRIVANNLASMLADRRDDAESLERAYLIARRLRDLPVPEFQDTYGWTLFRHGDVEEAVRVLEQAAQGLPDDPLVQVHLGLVYAAAGRDADAREPLQRALKLAGDDPLPQFEQARQILARIDPAPAQAPDPGRK